METLFVKDLMGRARGEVVEADFAIWDVDICPQKNGGSYLKLTLADKTGSLGAKWFDCDETRAWQCQDIRYGRVHGKVNDYNGKRGVIVTSIEDLGIPGDLSKFEQVAALPLNELNRRLDAHIATVRNPHLSALLGQIFCDGELRRKFEVVPAAMKNHHACRHGLLQHTVEVTDLAVAIANQQQTWGYTRKVERDLVVAGALLHDIGKVREIASEDGSHEMTRAGQLKGHVTLGYRLVIGRISRITEFPVALADALEHIILAHHGKLEWGSPVAPMMPEAQIVHDADLLDAQLFYMQEAETMATEEFAPVRNVECHRIFVSKEPLAPAAEPMLVRETAQVLSMRRTAIPVLRFATEGTCDVGHMFETRRLPLLGRVAAGMPLSAEPGIDEHVAVEAENLPSDPALYLLRVQGESMSGDGISDGDLVVIRPQEYHEPDDIVVALLRGENEAAIKRIEARDGMVFLVSSNPDYMPIPVTDPDDVAIRGKVVARLQAA